MTTTDVPPPRIVVGVDGSDESKLALQWAAKLSDALGAYVEAIIAWQYTPPFGWAVIASTWTPAGDADTTLTAAVDETFGADRPPNLRLTVREGYPPNVLINASKRATLLIVGSRGHRGLAGRRLGSVSNNVVHHAHCAVLVVHLEPDALESAAKGPS